LTALGVCLLLQSCSGTPARSSADAAAPPNQTRSAAVDAEPPPAELATAHERAVAAMARGDWLEAELELEQLVLAYPGYAGPCVNLAIVYLQDGRDSDAEAALLRALEADAQHAAANNELGILRRRQGRFAEAEAAYRAALEAAPDYALGHYNLAVLLDLYLHRPAEALEHYLLYQSLMTQPDERVARWIVDLKRQHGLDEHSPRVAAEDAS
jgi:lipoprotein NlpI